MAGDLQVLVAKLFITIRVLAGYPIPDRLPEVHLLPPQQLAAISCAGHCRPMGAYSPEHGVLLSDALDPIDDVRARGVLLHELVHHLQGLHGRFTNESPCRRYFLREREAYAVQNRYLERYGQPPDRGLVMMQWAFANCSAGERSRQLSE